jgi:hypothetical protein
MISYTDILATELNFNFDYQKISQEIYNCKQFWIYTPPYKSNLDKALNGEVFLTDDRSIYNQIDYIDDSSESCQIVHRSIRGIDIFYLKEIPGVKNNRFDYTKNADHRLWRWRPELKDLIPYTISAIEQLPLKNIGCVRVFLTENTIFPTHRDYGWREQSISRDIQKCLGISLIPETGDVPMMIQDVDGKIYNIFGNAMLFNDWAFHGVAKASGMRITIRVFGDLDFGKLECYISKNTIIYQCKSTQTPPALPLILPNAVS